MASVDNFFAVVTFFGVAILFITLIVFWNVVVVTPGFFDYSPTTTAIQANGQQAVDTFDFMLLMAYFGLHLGILVAAFLLRTHPVIYIVAILLTAILMLVAAPISNAYEDVIAEDSLSVASASIPWSNYIMSRLPMFEMVWCILTMIALFAMAKGEGLI